MNDGVNEDDPEIIMSELCTEVEVDGHFLTVEIYRSEIDAGWILEVINEFGTSTVFDNRFIADGMAWREFEKTLKEDGLLAFFTDEEKAKLVN